ncbi:pyridoxine biosynthesis protein [Coemansia thaxteri]|uniref:Pyridoxine biosynthesis protein n=1 Tax=Coemansia thaxteri TaxID=2663907 RepID=A0A9W8BBQ0_9FUNG|nr:pyridoxine biosynthesis protein [Coemansia thaxteri]
MPALSPTMTEGGIARWEKKEGEAFSAGDLLLQIETDKAQMDVEAQDDGVLVKILAPEGTQNVAVNSPIAIIAEEGDDVSSIDVAGLLASNPASTKADSGNAPATPAPASKAAVAEPASPAVVSQHLSGDTSAHGLLSPAVTFAIHANHIANAGEIAGSGPKGRILKGDVIQFLKDGKAIISKGAPSNAAAPAVATATAASSKPAVSVARSSAEAETAFLVQSLEPSVLRQLGELELARRSTTVQVPAEKLAKLVRSNRALSDTAFVLRAAALALHQVPLAKDGNTRVGVAVDGAKTPFVVEIAGASTTSVLDIAAAVKEARGQQPASSLPAVVVAAEGVYSPATLPANTAVLVVGRPHSVVSAVDASAALDSALNALVGGGKAKSRAPTSAPATVFDISFVGDSTAVAAFASKVKAFLSNPELLMF